MRSTDSFTSLLARSSLNQDNHRQGCDLERISDYQAMVFGHNSFIHVRGNNMLGSFPLTATGSLTLQVQQLHHQAIRLYGCYTVLKCYHLIESGRHIVANNTAPAVFCRNCSKSAKPLAAATTQTSGIWKHSV